ncbi:MAG: hypothetical protein WDW38_002112 [Sanguina aurantia]
MVFTGVTSDGSRCALQLKECGSSGSSAMPDSASASSCTGHAACPNGGSSLAKSSTPRFPPHADELFVVPPVVAAGIIPVVAASGQAEGQQGPEAAGLLQLLHQQPPPQQQQRRPTEGDVMQAFQAAMDEAPSGGRSAAVDDDEAVLPGPTPDPSAAEHARPSLGAAIRAAAAAAAAGERSDGSAATASPDASTSQQPPIAFQLSASHPHPSGLSKHTPSSSQIDLPQQQQQQLQRLQHATASGQSPAPQPAAAVPSSVPAAGATAAALEPAGTPAGTAAGAAAAAAGTAAAAAAAAAAAFQEPPHTQPPTPPPPAVSHAQPAPTTTTPLHFFAIYDGHGGGDLRVPLREAPARPPAGARGGRRRDGRGHASPAVRPQDLHPHHEAAGTRLRVPAHGDELGVQDAGRRAEVQRSGEDVAAAAQHASDTSSGSGSSSTGSSGGSSSSSGSRGAPGATAPEREHSFATESAALHAEAAALQLSLNHQQQQARPAAGAAGGGSTPSPAATSSSTPSISRPVTPDGHPAIPAPPTSHPTGGLSNLPAHGGDSSPSADPGPPLHPAGQIRTEGASPAAVQERGSDSPGAAQPDGAAESKRAAAAAAVEAAAAATAAAAALAAASLALAAVKEGVLLESSLLGAFAMVDNELHASRRARDVGSTAVVALLGPRHVWVANCGDSRAILCRNGLAVPLSLDHKATRRDEIMRVEAAGGYVWFDRVMGELAVSRAIGDHCLRPYVIAIPDITRLTRQPGDSLLILASDGLWDVCNNQDVCSIALHAFKGELSGGSSSSRAVRAAARALVKAALGRGTQDNVTALVVDLRLHKHHPEHRTSSPVTPTSTPTATATAAAPTDAATPMPSPAAAATAAKTTTTTTTHAGGANDVDSLDHMHAAATTTMPPRATAGGDPAAAAAAAAAGPTAGSARAAPRESAVGRSVAAAAAASLRANSKSGANSGRPPLAPSPVTRSALSSTTTAACPAVLATDGLVLPGA